jgi:hypothetical protein
MKKIFLMGTIIFVVFILSDYPFADTIYHSFPKDLRYKKESILIDNCIVVKYEEDKKKSPWQKPYIRYYSWDSKRNVLLIDTVMAKKNEKFRVEYSDPQQRKKLISSIKESGTHFIITKSNGDSINIFCVRIDYRHPKYMRHFDPAGDTSFYFQVKGTSDAKEIPISDIAIIKFYEDEAKIKLKDGKELLGKFLGKVIGGKEFYEIYLEGLDKAGNLIDASNRTSINLKEVYKIEFVRPDARGAYHNYGMSFRYPANMTITEEPYMDNAVTEKSGSLKLISNDVPVRMIDILWLSTPYKERTSQIHLEELLKKLGGKAIYETEPGLERYGERAVIEKRYVSILRVGFVRSKGIFSCNNANRVYIITATRPAKGIIKAFPGMKVEDIKLPPKNQDPTYRDYRLILESFRCDVQ